MNKKKWVIFWPEDGSDPETVISTDEVTSIGQFQGSNNEALTGQDCVVILPSLLVSNHIIEVPIKQRRSLAKAFPYLLEDELLLPIEAMHCVYQEKEADTDSLSLFCLAVPKLVMDAVYDFINRAKLTVSAVFVDGDLVPVPPLGRTAVIELGPGKYLSRLPCSAFYLSAGEANFWAEGLSVDRMLTKVNCSSGYFTEKISKGVPSINLLQGDYQSKAERHGLKRKLKPLVYLASILFLFQLSYWLAGAAVYDYYSKTYQQSSEKIYRDIFPSETRIVDLRNQALGHLQSVGKLKSDNNVLKLFFAFSTVLENSGINVVIESTRIDKRAAKAVIELSTDSVPSAESLVAGLAALNIQAKLHQAKKEGDHIRARLRISLKTGN